MNYIIPLVFIYILTWLVLCFLFNFPWHDLNIFSAGYFGTFIALMIWESFK